MPAKPPTPRSTFAANITRIREQRGLTQEQLGWEAGLHQTAIARIESGEREPRLATVFRVAAALEVPPAALFEGID